MEDSTLRLTPEQLSRLLGIAEQAEPAPDRAAQEEIRAAALRELLTRRLRPVKPAPDILHPRAAQVPRGPSPDTGRTLGEVLLDEHSDLGTINEVKAHGKSLVRANEGDSDADHAAATVVYYAAIANGLVAHGRRITRLGPDYLDAAFAKLQDKAWIGPPFRDLFAKARAACRQHAGNGDSANGR